MVKSRWKILFIHPFIPLICFPVVVRPPSLLEIKLSEDRAIFKLCRAARKPGGEEAGRPAVPVCVCVREQHRLLGWIDGLGYHLPQLESLTASFILHERMWRAAVGKQPYTPWKTITRLCWLQGQMENVWGSFLGFFVVFVVLVCFTSQKCCGSCFSTCVYQTNIVCCFTRKALCLVSFNKKQSLIFHILSSFFLQEIQTIKARLQLIV